MARRVELVTWDDLIQHLIDWMGANPTAEARRDSRRASLHAVRDVSNAFNWTYYYCQGRLNTYAPYQEGTVAYDHTGGTYERMATLTGGAWPSWAAQAVLVIGGIKYEVYSRKSDTVLTLATASNPGDDLADTAYTLFQEGFPLPSNFQAMGELVIAGNTRVLQQDNPSTWLARQRIFHGVATPFCYSILGDPGYQNTLMLAFYPPPDAAYSVDFIFKRRPRELRVEGVSAGKATATSGASTLAGTGTAWTAKMAGSVVRLGGTAAVPTGRVGGHPFEEERVVVSVADAATLTVDAPWDDNHSGVKYLISDPVDIDVGSMFTAVLRCCELNTAAARTRGDRNELSSLYREALMLAREADARNFKMESVGQSVGWPQRLADMPFAGNA